MSQTTTQTIVFLTVSVTMGTSNNQNQICPNYTLQLETQLIVLDMTNSMYFLHDNFFKRSNIATLKEIVVMFLPMKIWTWKPLLKRSIWTMLGPIAYSSYATVLFNVIPIILAKAVRGECMESQKRIIMDIQD